MLLVFSFTVFLYTVTTTDTTVKFNLGRDLYHCINPFDTCFRSTFDNTDTREFTSLLSLLPEILRCGLSL